MFKWSKQTATGWQGKLPFARGMTLPDPLGGSVMDDAGDLALARPVREVLRSLCYGMSLPVRGRRPVIGQRSEDSLPDELNKNESHILPPVAHTFRGRLTSCNPIAGLMAVGMSIVTWTAALTRWKLVDDKAVWSEDRLDSPVAGQAGA